MLLTTCSLLPQQLLIAKRGLRLQKFIKQLSRYEGLMIDDLRYVQQSREEIEVLFTLLAERHERGSVLLTSNLAFSKWDQIFKDAMTRQYETENQLQPNTLKNRKSKTRYLMATGPLVNYTRWKKYGKRIQQQREQRHGYQKWAFPLADASIGHS